mgnify:FL=1|jgi:carbamoylphosphate synthase large subunit
MTFTLLMTCVGGELSPQIINYIKSSERHDIRVVGVDASSEATGRHFVDVFSIVPNGTDPGYVDAIAELSRLHDVNMILPTSDEEALALSAARSQLETSDCVLACSSSEVLQTVSNKAECYRKLEALGIQGPAWKEVNDIDTLATTAAEFVANCGDIVVKPATERGGRGVSVVRGDITGAIPYAGGREVHMDHATFQSKYLQSYTEDFPVIVMERLVEPVYDIDMLAFEGKPIRVVPRRRVDSALPNEGHQIVDNQDLIDLGRKIITGLDLSWLYDCDVMYDGAGKPIVLEINPRPSGSVSVCIAAGVPLIDDLISIATGGNIPEIDIPAGRMVIPYKALAQIN